MTGSAVWQVLGWLALALNVWGNLALTQKGISGWVVRLLSNACWIPYGICTGAWALMANHLLFVAINGYGWWKWSKAARPPVSDGVISPTIVRGGAVCGHPHCEICDPRARNNGAVAS